MGGGAGTQNEKHVKSLYKEFTIRDTSPYFVLLHKCFNDFDIYVTDINISGLDEMFGGL